MLVHASTFETEHPIARRGERRVVRDDDRCQAILSVYFPEQPMQIRRCRFVEIAGRFVGEEQRGPADQSSRHSHPLLLSS